MRSFIVTKTVTFEYEVNADTPEQAKGTISRDPTRRWKSRLVQYGCVPKGD